MSFPAKTDPYINLFDEFINELGSLPFSLVKKQAAPLYNNAKNTVFTLWEKERENIIFAPLLFAAPYGKWFFYTLSMLSLEGLKTTKTALRILGKDLLESGLIPISNLLFYIDIPLENTLALNIAAIALFTHHIAIHYLKEDPNIAESITHGALTGTFISYVARQDLCIGTLSGAFVGLVTDTTISYFSLEKGKLFFIRTYENSKWKPLLDSIYRIASKTFPFFSFAAGTSLIYYQIRPLIAKELELLEESAKKVLILKTMALSSLLFGLLKATVPSLLRGIGTCIKTLTFSIDVVKTLVSWTPRVCAVISSSAILHYYCKK